MGKRNSEQNCMFYLSRTILVLVCLVGLFLTSAFSQNDSGKDLLLIRINEKAGFINSKGEIIIKPQFDDAEYFFEGLAPVKIDNKWGLINQIGEIVIEPKFDSIFWSWFSEGVIPVSIDGKMGAIDKTGKFIIEPKYQFMGKFSEGVVPVRIEKSEYIEKWVYIDNRGNKAISKEFFGADSFVNGRAFVKVGFDEWALINKDGKEITKQHFNSFDNYNMFSEGLVAVKVKKKYGYINANGKFVIKPRFEMAENFSEGFAIVYDGCNYGYINAKGKYVIKPQFNFAGNFSDGLASFSPAKKNKIIFKDSDGKSLCFGIGHGEIGYIDKTGKIVIEPQFGFGFDFSNGIAQVSFGEPPDVIGYIGNRGYIDKTGKYIWQPTK